jgi:HSP20 family protein
MAEKGEEKGVTPRPARPMRSLREMFEDMDRLWDGFPSLLRMRPFAAEPAWPAIDVFERNGSLTVKADIPGMTAKDIDITVNEDSVTISGERTEEKEVKEKDYYRSERSYGRFMRQVPLPSGVDREKAQATFKDGVLEVSFPLKEEAKQKKIEVKSA